MPEQTHIPKPEFVIADIDENISAKRLEQDIFKRPEAYRTALVLGSIALVEGEEGSPVEPDVAKTLDDFFKYRFDKAVYFDDASEDALAADETHRNLIRTMQTTRNAESADTLRREISYNRFAFFIDRVIEWKGQAKPQKTRLRRTG